MICLCAYSTLLQLFESHFGMVTSCVVYGCINRVHGKNTEGVSFHRFPKDEVRREQWEKAVGRAGWRATVKSCICSVHFEPAMFDRTGQTVRLRLNAVPCVFPTGANHSKKVTKKTRKIPICQLPPSGVDLDVIEDTSSQDRIRQESCEAVSPTAAGRGEIGSSLPVITPTKSGTVWTPLETSATGSYGALQAKLFKRKQDQTIESHPTQTQTSPTSSDESPQGNLLKRKPDRTIESPTTQTPATSSYETLQGKLLKRKLDLTTECPATSSDYTPQGKLLKEVLDQTIESSDTSSDESPSVELPRQTPGTNSYESPREQLLKRKLDRAAESLTKYKKRIKVLQQNRRRLIKRCTSLQDVIQRLKNEYRISENPVDVVIKSLPPDQVSSEIVERLIRKSCERSDGPTVYSPAIRSFALTLDSYSSSAYSYVRKTFHSCLPHRRTLQKWYSTVKGEPDFTSEEFQAMQMKVKTAQGNKPKVFASLMSDDASIRNIYEFQGILYDEDCVPIGDLSTNETEHGQTTYSVSEYVTQAVPREKAKKVGQYLRLPSNVKVIASVNSDEQDIEVAELYSDTQHLDMVCTTATDTCSVSQESVPQGETSPVSDNIFSNSFEVEPFNESTNLGLIQSNTKQKVNYEELTPFKFFCSLCSFKCKQESHYQCHLQLHNQVSPIFACYKCNFTTVRLGHLRRHELSHSSLLACNLCHYRTNNHKFLAKHKRIKHNAIQVIERVEGMLYCMYCKYRTSKNHFFQRHLQLHSSSSSNKTQRSYQYDQESAGPDDGD